MAALLSFQLPFPRTPIGSHVHRNVPGSLIPKEDLFKGGSLLPSPSWDSLHPRIHHLPTVGHHETNVAPFHLWFGEPSWFCNQKTRFVTHHLHFLRFIAEDKHFKDKYLEKACKYLLFGCPGHDSIPAAASGTCTCSARIMEYGNYKTPQKMRTHRVMCLSYLESQPALKPHAKTHFVFKGALDLKKKSHVMNWK